MAIRTSWAEPHLERWKRSIRLTKSISFALQVLIHYYWQINGKQPSPSERISAISALWLLAGIDIHFGSGVSVKMKWDTAPQSPRRCEPKTAPFRGLLTIRHYATSTANIQVKKMFNQFAKCYLMLIIFDRGCRLACNRFGWEHPSPGHRGVCWHWQLQGLGYDLGGIRISMSHISERTHD